MGGRHPPCLSFLKWPPFLGDHSFIFAGGKSWFLGVFVDLDFSRLYCHGRCHQHHQCPEEKHQAWQRELEKSAGQCFLKGSKWAVISWVTVVYIHSLATHFSLYYIYTHICIVGYIYATAHSELIMFLRPGFHAFTTGIFLYKGGRLISQVFIPKRIPRLDSVPIFWGWDHFLKIRCRTILHAYYL